MTRGLIRIPAAILLAVALSACGDQRGPLPNGAELGSYSDVDEPEVYPGPRLYRYMDGGAELYLEFGCSRLWVRRYAQGSARLITELFEMRDAEAAAAIYSYLRRAGTEREIVGGCPASVTLTEVLLARGRHFLVCRSEDPLAARGTMVHDLCVRLADRLPGECGVGRLFISLPAEDLVPGSQVALLGPIGLNLRPWLSSVGRHGFQRGRLAAYRTASGVADVLIAEYADVDSARRSAQGVTSVPPSGLYSRIRDRRVVFVRAGSLRSSEVDRLAMHLLPN